MHMPSTKHKAKAESCLWLNTRLEPTGYSASTASAAAAANKAAIKQQMVQQVKQQVAQPMLQPLLWVVVQAVLWPEKQ